MISESPLHFIEFSLNGEKLEKKENEEFLFNTKNKKHILTYYFTKNDTILDLKFVIPNNETPDLQIIESSYDLFKNNHIKSIKANIQPRNEIMMPTPFVLNDAVVIKKKIEL